MKTEILIATWSKDIDYLVWNLKSIRKFASGFEGTTLLVAEQETPLFDPIASEFGCRVATYDRVPDAARWHIQMQGEKCCADIHCPDADFILHTDSDCAFTEAVTPEDYFVGGKPVMLIEQFSRLQNNPWQEPTEYALGFPCLYETMRRHPQVNPRGIYAPLRNHVGLRHHMNFEHYVITRKADYPWGISEHCLLGAFALGRPEWKSQYIWIDVGAMARPKDKIIQHWSHSPIDQPQDLPSGGRGCPIETYRRLGLA